MPWDFMKTVIEQHGLSAAVLLMVIIASGMAIRALYKRNQELSQEMSQIQVQEHKKRSDMREALNDELMRMREAYASEISTVKQSHGAAVARIHEEWRKDDSVNTTRINDLQEKRIVEAQDFVREATRHVASTREEIGKISKAMDMLTNVMTGRRP